MYNPKTITYTKSILNKTNNYNEPKNKSLSKDLEMVFNEETQQSFIQYLKDANIEIPTEEILSIEEKIKKAKSSNLKIDAINDYVFAEGVKFGHLLKQTVGGMWAYDLKKHPYPFIKVSESFSINPISKVYKFYEYGEVESLLTMYLSMLILMSTRNSN